MQERAPPPAWRLSEEADGDAFFNDLLVRGYSRVQLENVGETRLGFELCAQFHNTNGASASPYDETIEFGYSTRSATQGKAFHAVKLAQPMEMLPWPRTGDFAARAARVFRALDAEARSVLRVVAGCLGVDVAKVMAMLDDDPLPCNEASASFMHLFDYQPLAHVGSETCVPHTDSGMVTIIPSATTPGLEVLDWSTLQWVPVEVGADSTTATVLIGEPRLFVHARARGGTRIESQDTQARHWRGSHAIICAPPSTESCPARSRASRSRSSCAPACTRRSTVWRSLRHCTASRPTALLRFAFGTSSDDCTLRVGFIHTSTHVRTCTGPTGHPHARTLAPSSPRRAINSRRHARITRVPRPDRVIRRAADA